MAVKECRVFTGKGDYASNSVFLPAAGYCNGGFVDYWGRLGFYWSSTPNGGYYAWRLYFGSFVQDMDNANERFLGYSVRAVLAED